MTGEVAKKYRKGLLETIKFLQQLHQESIDFEQENCHHEKNTFCSNEYLGYYACVACNKGLTTEERKKSTFCTHINVSREHIFGCHGEKETKCLDCGKVLQ